ncbi:MAG: acetyl-CoA hydrolase/transferase family protein [Chloroflexi bacterium]|nr:acetyl-CoA hydrolase/transferase family protein [Chloroflexota bacterium]
MLRDGLEELYRRKVTTTTDAARCIVSDSRVYLGGSACVPRVLERAMIERAAELRNVEVMHVLALAGGQYLEPQYAQSFRHRALFLGENARQAVREGRADYTPIFLGEIAGLFRDGSLPIDVAMILVSPPDEHGYCSLGPEVGATKSATLAAARIIAEVNPQVPRVYGDTFIHVSKLDAIVETDYPLATLPRAQFTETFLKIGAHVADLIPDGATIQTGIGAIPDAVLFHLKGKQHLGIHSELFSDGIISLIESGVITGERKTIHPGKVVAGMAIGSAVLYDFIRDNALIEMHPNDYVNDPFIIAQHDNMVAINSAIEIDLTGQVCADSIGTQFYSGIGGQVDFVRGAARSKGGKPIIAMQSTARSDTLSRIVTQLKPGAGVVTSRGDVHYVVTEYGVAYLHGKSIRERARALIRIAHPAFRDELERYAREQHWN